MENILGDKKKEVYSKKEKRIPFVITFHPRLKILQEIIDKNLFMLYMNEEVKETFALKPMISYRSSHKINSCLVRVKLYSIKITVSC